MAASLVLALAAGCAPEVVGPGLVGTLEGRWTIDGAPPNVTRCEGAGIEEVQIVTEEVSGSGLLQVAITCESGEVQVNRPTLLPGRTYLLRLEGLRGGEVVMRGPERTIEVPPGGGRFVAPEWNIVSTGI
jgi:hypothetical protein